MNLERWLIRRSGRKIRCGKQRPSCHQCLQARRQCQGYNTWELTLRESGQHHGERPEQPPTIGSTPRAYVHDINVNDEMRHAFDYFRHCSRKQYAKRGYPTLWANRAITICGSQPAVFFSLVALGCLESSTHDMVHTSLARPGKHARPRLALAFYSIAIKQMTRAVLQAELPHASLEAVIVSCAIFVVLEVMKGNPLAAMIHARLGNRILNERLGELECPPTIPVGSLFMPTSFVESPLAVVLPDLEFRQTFSTLEEARQHLETLTSAGQDLHSGLLQLSEEVINQLVDSSILQKPATRFCLLRSLSKSVLVPPSTELRLQRVQRGYVCWKTAFAELNRMDTHIPQNALRLQVRFFCARMVALSCRRTDEQWTDSCYQDFSDTLEAVERLLRLQHFDSPVADDLIRRLDAVEGDRTSPHTWFDDLHPQPPMFGPFHASASGPNQAQAAGLFGQGILLALFTIACKCRVFSIRHRAAEILSQLNRFEGQNASQQLGRFATAFISVEEQQNRWHLACAPPFGELRMPAVAEAARLGDAVFLSTDNGNAVHLSCTRYLAKHKSQIQLKEYQCTNMEHGTKGPCIGQVFEWQGSIGDT